MNEDSKKEVDETKDNKKIESEILKVFTNNVECNTELLIKTFDILNKIHRRDVIKDGVTFSIFISLLIILYLF